jgi:hypothetical protein
MKTQIYRSGALVLATLFLACRFGYAERNATGVPAPPSVDRYSSSSLPDNSATVSTGNGVIRAVPFEKPDTRTFRPFTAIGFAWRTGVGGVGLDVATPLARKFNLRAGFDYFRYTFNFQEEGADITANLRFGSGHASVDWFPFGGRFRLSPMFVFANNNRIQATALIPSGSSLSMNGQDYFSSKVDPLHGSGSVTFRKTSPGLTLGFGNLIPRTRSHVSIPVEVGFYYVNQPRLKVDFAGKGCDPNYPEDIGCGAVMDDEGFRNDLAAFVARNNHNLSYASFLPIASIGFGYSF